ncbi:hypothetical protein RND71_044152 [Anisodus tanguticus]|uniref:Uncharacterized protein n=1 Tax=Anisodus tanguticus TaxID=243964 RepID=A0AAE1UT79_9SOLA|nr:hypothetical protein RND71_044152 [Anisodus tanguticus]
MKRRERERERKREKRKEKEEETRYGGKWVFDKVYVVGPVLSTDKRRVEERGNMIPDRRSLVNAGRRGVACGGGGRGISGLVAATQRSSRGWLGRCEDGTQLRPGTMSRPSWYDPGSKTNKKGKTKKENKPKHGEASNEIYALETIEGVEGKFIIPEMIGGEMKGLGYWRLFLPSFCSLSGLLKVLGGVETRFSITSKER